MSASTSFLQLATRKLFSFFYSYKFIYRRKEKHYRYPTKL